MRPTGKTVAAAAFTLVLATVIEAGAQCDFRPGTGSRLKVSMIRAYDSCRQVAINTTTEVGIEACSPVSLAPRAYQCTTRPLPCAIDDAGACPIQYCGGSPDVAHSYRYCIDNSDCAVSPPESTGICETHLENRCIAISAGSSYLFEDRGSCVLAAASRVESDCSQVTDERGGLLGLPSQPCHVTALEARCRGIVTTGGVRVSGAAYGGWTLATLTRVTLDDPAGGDMTQVDFPVTFLFGEPRNGSLRLESSTAEALLPMLGASGAALPPCVVLQPLDARVVDPDGETFATVGISTRP